MTSAFTREIRWMLGRLRPYRWSLAFALLGLVLGDALTLSNPLIIRWMADYALPRNDLRALILGAVAFAINQTGCLLLTGMSNVSTANITQRVACRLRLLLFQHLNRQTASYYSVRPTGQTLFLVQQDAAVAAEACVDLLVTAVRIVVLMGVILTAIFTLNWKLSCIVFPLAPVFVYIRKHFQIRLAQRTRQSQKEEAMTSSFLEQSLSSVIQTQLLRQESKMRSEYLHLMQRSSEAVMSRKRVETTYVIASQVVMLLGVAVLLGWGSYSVVAGSLTIGSLVAFYSYLARMFHPLSDLASIGVRLERCRVSADRVLEVLTTVPEVANRPGAEDLKIDSLHIRFEDVSFCYSGHPVLKRISFEIEPGERVALFGPTGSGKTTIARLMARLYDVTDGRVLICGRDVRDVTLRSLRAVVSLVPQEPAYYGGTLRDNITFGHPAAAESELYRATRIAQVLPIVDRLPLGWEQPVGPRGVTLSGGERQRVAIARAILMNQRVLILDEATSGLDGPTEGELLDGLEEILPGRIIVIVSHRPSILAWADKVLFLQDGCLSVQPSRRQMVP
jgi:ABC-type multidrug transport system fused ATPase/permease subunit